MNPVAVAAGLATLATVGIAGSDSSLALAACVDQVQLGYVDIGEGDDGRPLVLSAVIAADPACDGARVALRYRDASGAVIGSSHAVLAGGIGEAVTPGSTDVPVEDVASVSVELRSDLPGGTGAIDLPALPGVPGAEGPGTDGPGTEAPGTGEPVAPGGADVGTGGDGGVLGESTDRAPAADGGGTGGLGVALPRTGAGVLALVGGSAALVAAGGAALIASRRRRPGDAEPGGSPAAAP